MTRDHYDTITAAAGVFARVQAPAPHLRQELRSFVGIARPSSPATAVTFTSPLPPLDRSEGHGAPRPAGSRSVGSSGPTRIRERILLGSTPASSHGFAFL